MKICPLCDGQGFVRGDVYPTVRERQETIMVLEALARRVREKMSVLDVADDAYSIELYALAMSALRALKSLGPPWEEKPNEHI